MIFIIDFGSQTTHLISRRLGELGARANIVLPGEAIKKVEELKPKGIIFSGGPSSVFNNNSPSIDKKIFKASVPVLGICYGQQLIAHLLGGKVKPGGIKEYGPAELKVETSPLFANIPVSTFKVWMSHGDEVLKLPNGFRRLGRTENILNGSIGDEKRNIYGVQFHPEAQHTAYGLFILKNFLEICGEKLQHEDINIENIINNIKGTVGEKKVIMAFSGGTDSFVSATLMVKAIGKNLIPVYVESGLMRSNFLYNVSKVFPKIFGFRPKIVRAQNLFLKKLKGIVSPEKKRKTIGKLYIKLFERIALKTKGIEFLAQGTTYADFIHSKSTKYAALIKSHHNVGGLPKKMKLKLLEPIRYFYTDQVRYIGKKLGLPDEVIYQQPFPGPGFAVRILGKVTPKRLTKVKLADKIVIEEIEKAGLEKKIFQFFAILTGTKSTGIKGDGRFYGEVVAVRAYTSRDRMTADWAKIPYKILGKISTRIVNEVPAVSRVVYDITTKPPATMEWE